MTRDEIDDVATVLVHFLEEGEEYQNTYAHLTTHRDFPLWVRVDTKYGSHLSEGDVWVSVAIRVEEWDDREDEWGPVREYDHHQRVGVYDEAHIKDQIAETLVNALQCMQKTVDGGVLTSPPELQVEVRPAPPPANHLDEDETQALLDRLRGWSPR